MENVYSRQDQKNAKSQEVVPTCFRTWHAITFPIIRSVLSHSRTRTLGGCIALSPTWKPGDFSRDNLALSRERDGEGASANKLRLGWRGHSTGFPRLFWHLTSMINQPGLERERVGVGESEMIGVRSVSNSRGKIPTRFASGECSS